MSRICSLVVLFMVSGIGIINLAGQQVGSTINSPDSATLQSSSPAPGGAVPRLVKFIGSVHEANGKVPFGPASLTFSLYALQEGGSPLWSETQSANVDAQGNYRVLLGATSSAGLPQELFSSGQALWLGVQPQLSGVGEMPRVLLVAVPYALKASDSDTLGGKPASAYALAGSQPLLVPTGGASTSSASATTSQPDSQAVPAAGSSSSSPQTQNACAAVTSDGTATANTVAKFTSACNVENSLIRDNGTGVAVGGTSAPGALLDVQYTSTGTSGSLLGQRVLSTFNPAAVSSASNIGAISDAQTAAGNTQNFTGYLTAMDFSVNHYGKGTLAAEYGMIGYAVNSAAGTISKAVGSYTSLENVSTGTITNGYGMYVNAPVNSGGGKFSNYTGLYIANPSAVTGAYGLYSAGGLNYFAGNVGIGTSTPQYALDVHGTGNFTGAVAVAGLTSGRCVQAGAGGVLTTAASPCGSGGGATLGPNTFTGTQTVASGDVFVSNGNLDLPATAGATAGVINLGGSPFIHACCPNSAQNTFVGPGAGNFTANATSSNSGSGQNTAVGYEALQVLTSGIDNTASGGYALAANTTGSNNTAVGYQAAFYFNGRTDIPKGVSNSTFVGSYATPTVDSLTNATAIGYNAQVAESNALVLGNGASVGIGTSSPAALLDIEGGTAASGNGLEGLQLVSQAGGVNNTSGGTGGNGGTITLTGGAGGADNSGSGNGGGGGGAVVITGGNGGPENGQASISNAGNGGSITIQGGQSGSGGSGGNAGNILLAPGGGLVGIGTTTPGVMLDINSTGGIDFLLGQYSGTQRFHVDAFGNFYGNTFNPGGADFAESVAVRGSRSQYEPGDLLVIERGAHRRLTLSSTPYSTLVAGIYSTKPGVLATPHSMDDEQLKQEVPLAVVGIVPCKVTAENGAIEEGDLLVTSSRAGHAMKGTDRSRMLGAVVGKALEPLPEGTGVIQVLVTLQ